ncbi:hypothetical protein COUCH_38160 [Couchioplanes caeruleus]|uniref:hypothetical protein n=1 Tax=Couchioplanes caeruleus TaxID=56438 RepID=UPI0020BD7065|nr:hypothetical protein [Couchioplanes caeruleus]UQU64693.1 hypothetical protein COUCH_38160 [Couchioplanes caeruleus]
MGADLIRSPGSFRRLGERLLGGAFPAMDAEEVDRYLDRAVARVHEATGTRPLQRLRANRAEVLELVEIGREDFRSAHPRRPVAVLTPDDVIAHLGRHPAMKLPARRLVLDFADALDVIRTLDEVSDAATVIELPADGTPDLALSVSSGPPSARDRVRGLAAELATGLAGARNLVRAVDLAIDSAVDLASALRDRDLARGLADARASARHLDQSLGLDHVLTGDLRRDLERGRPVRPDRPAYAEVDRAGDRAHLRRLADSVAFARAAAQQVRDALARDVARMFLRIGRLDLDRLDDESAEALREAVNDLRGADLRSVNLVGVDLEGIRWSPATRWPEDWRAQVDRDSVLIGDGVFEVRPGAKTAGTHLLLAPL